MTKSIMLAKPYTPEKLNFPVFVSEKLDGVPIKFGWEYQKDIRSSQLIPRTRQDEIPTSVYHIWQEVRKILPYEVGLTVGEVTSTQFRDFKDVSGSVRKNEPSEHLRLNIFDGYGTNPGACFPDRINAIQEAVESVLGLQFIQLVKQYQANDQSELDLLLETITAKREDGTTPEGAVIRSFDEAWEPGNRSWGYQKYLPKPTIDLRLHRILEATGGQSGLSGRMEFWYHDQIIGAGPGKLTHVERQRLWESYSRGNYKLWPKGVGPLVTLAYKPDPSYGKLREARFLHWRTDKTEADA